MSASGSSRGVAYRMNSRLLSLFSRAGWLRGVPLSLAWAGALGCMAWVASVLFWQWAGPVVEVLPQAQRSEARALVQRIGAQRPFVGQAQDAGQEVAALAAAPQPVWRVHAVATGFAGGPGFALLGAGEGAAAQPFAVGEELSPGVRLVALLADGVELEQHGRRVLLRLPAPAAEPARAASVPAAGGHAAFSSMSGD